MSYLNEDDIKRLAENKCCGACEHWHRWDLQKEVEYWNSNPYGINISQDESSLHYGDCDKFKNVTFEDNSFADESRCFKLRKKGRKK